MTRLTADKNKLFTPPSDSQRTLNDPNDYLALCCAIEIQDNETVEEVLKDAQYKQVPALLGMKAPLMHQACIHNNIEAAKLLIEAGFNVNDKNLEDDNGWERLFS